MIKLEHIGIAVDDAEAVAALYNHLLGHPPYKAETVDAQGVRTHFIAAGTAKLELLEALVPTSPVAKYLDKRGPGLHHLAFEVPDIDAHFAQMQAAGFQPLGTAPSTGADGKRIFFLHPKQTHGVLVEFCQSTPTPITTTTISHRGNTWAMVECGTRTSPSLLVVPPPETAVFPALEMLLRRLEPHLHVCTLDTQHITTPAQLAEAAADIRTTLGHTQTHLLGLGTGCEAALSLATEDPDQMGHIMLHAPSISQRFDQPVLLSLTSDDARALPDLMTHLPQALPVVLPASSAPAFAPDAALFVPVCLRYLLDY